MSVFSIWLQWINLHGWNFLLLEYFFTSMFNKFLRALPSIQTRKAYFSLYFGLSEEKNINVHTSSALQTRTDFTIFMKAITTFGISWIILRKCQLQTKGMHAMGVTLSWYKPRKGTKKQSHSEGKKIPHSCHHTYPHCPPTFPLKIQYKTLNHQATQYSGGVLVLYNHFPGSSWDNYLVWWKENMFFTIAKKG